MTTINKNEIQIRQAREEDVPALVELRNKLSKVSAFVSPRTIPEETETFDTYRRTDASGYLLVSYRGLVIGCCVILVKENRYFKTKAVYFGRLMVDQDYQGNGVAQKLIQAVVERTRELNHPGIFLFVNPNNKHAIQLYKRLGFFDSKYVIKDKAGVHTEMVYPLPKKSFIEQTFKRPKFLEW